MCCQGAADFLMAYFFAFLPGVLDHDHGIVARGNDVAGVYPDGVFKNHRVLFGGGNRVPACHGNPVHGGKVDLRDRETG